MAKDIAALAALAALLGPDAVMTVASFDLTDDGRVTRLWVVRNPE
ncbi:hypothetical protein ACFWGE_06860 [Streptomyces bacillaris]|nr:hypothetical protein [Streptomyces cavourensis]